VVLAEVQRIEVEPLRLELGSLCDLVPHGDEDVRDALAEHADRVPGPGWNPVPGQGDIDGLRTQHPGVPLGLQRDTALLKGPLGGRPALVESPTGLSPGLRWERADLAAGGKQRRPVTQVSGFDRGQLREVGGRGERLLRVLDGLCQRLGSQHGNLLRVVGVIGSGHVVASSCASGPSAASLTCRDDVWYCRRS
jgi:hypothetical protein